MDIQAVVTRINELLRRHSHVKLPAAIFALELEGDTWLRLDPNVRSVTWTDEAGTAGASCKISTTSTDLAELVERPSSAPALLFKGKIRVTQPKHALDLAMALQKILEADKAPRS